MTNPTEIGGLVLIIILFTLLVLNNVRLYHSKKLLTDKFNDIIETTRTSNTVAIQTFEEEIVLLKKQIENHKIINNNQMNVNTIKDTQFKILQFNRSAFVLQFYKLIDWYFKTKRCIDVYKTLDFAIPNYSKIKIFNDTFYIINNIIYRKNADDNSGIKYICITLDDIVTFLKNPELGNENRIETIKLYTILGNIYYNIMPAKWKVNINAHPEEPEENYVLFSKIHVKYDEDTYYLYNADNLEDAIEIDYMQFLNYKAIAENTDVINHFNKVFNYAEYSNEV